MVLAHRLPIAQHPAGPDVDRLHRRLRHPAVGDRQLRHRPSLAGHPGPGVVQVPSEVVEVVDRLVDDLHVRGRRVEAGDQAEQVSVGRRHRPAGEHVGGDALHRLVGHGVQPHRGGHQVVAPVVRRIEVAPVAERELHQAILPPGEVGTSPGSGSGHGTGRAALADSAP